MQAKKIYSEFSSIFDGKLFFKEYQVFSLSKVLCKIYICKMST